MRTEDYELEAIEEQQEAESGFVFDFGRLEHRVVTTSSLTDLYGFPVFSETFGLQVQQYSQIRRERLEELYWRVFEGEQATDLEEYFVAVMQADTQLIIQADWEPPPPMESPLLMVGFASVGVVVACMVWFLVEKINKMRKKE